MGSRAGKKPCTRPAEPPLPTAAAARGFLWTTNGSSQLDHHEQESGQQGCSRAPRPGAPSRCITTNLPLCGRRIRRGAVRGGREAMECCHRVGCVLARLGRVARVRRRAKGARSRETPLRRLVTYTRRPLQRALQVRRVRDREVAGTARVRSDRQVPRRGLVKYPPGHR